MIETIEVFRNRLSSEIQALVIDTKQYISKTDNVYFMYLKRRNLAKEEPNKEIKDQQMIEAKKLFEKELKEVK